MHHGEDQEQHQGARGAHHQPKVEGAQPRQPACASLAGGPHPRAHDSELRTPTTPARRPPTLLAPVRRAAAAAFALAPPSARAPRARRLLFPSPLTGCTRCRECVAAARTGPAACSTPPHLARPAPAAHRRAAVPAVGSPSVPTAREPRQLAACTAGAQARPTTAAAHSRGASALRAEAPGAPNWCTAAFRAWASRSRPRACTRCRPSGALRDECVHVTLSAVRHSTLRCTLVCSPRRLRHHGGEARRVGVRRAAPGPPPRAPPGGMRHELHVRVHAARAPPLTLWRREGILGGELITRARRVRIEL